MELQFYPGTKVSIVLKNSSITGQCEARGGLASRGNEAHMAEEPTWQGTYFNGNTKVHRTPTRPFSRKVCGTPLLNKSSNIWLQLPPSEWTLGGFRPTAFRCFKNFHRNKRFDISEPLVGRMLPAIAQRETEQKTKATGNLGARDRM